jgi:hypothetical protein
MNSGWPARVHVLLFFNYFKGALNEEKRRVGFVFPSHYT